MKISKYHLYKHLACGVVSISQIVTVVQISSLLWLPFLFSRASADLRLQGLQDFPGEQEHLVNESWRHLSAQRFLKEVFRGWSTHPATIRVSNHVSDSPALGLSQGQWSLSYLSVFRTTSVQSAGSRNDGRREMKMNKAKTPVLKLLINQCKWLWRMTALSSTLVYM